MSPGVLMGSQAGGQEGKQRNLGTVWALVIRVGHWCEEGTGTSPRHVGRAPPQLAAQASSPSPWTLPPAHTLTSLPLRLPHQAPHLSGVE